VVLFMKIPMWPFKQKNNEIKYIKKSFGQFLSPKLIEDVLSSNIDIPELHEKEIEYLFILAKEGLRTNQIISDVLDIISNYEGMVESITGPFIVVLYGVPLPQPNAKEKRQRLTDELLSKFEDSVSIVHGNTTCRVGTVGNKSRFAYTAMIPSYKEKLKILSSLEYGNQVEP
ncbi:hypothetical protein, partial [Desulforegula conservatrix]|uniref:hypothetical protein n=1 Tax=Desulforegula conservatrix TaxID=153026 RepID=UPI00055826A2